MFNDSIIAMKRLYNLKIHHVVNPKYITHESTEIPPCIDLRPKCPPIYDQGDLGSCTANALVAAFNFDDNSFTGSRLFLYYNERMLDGIEYNDKTDVSTDAGSTIQQGINALTRFGVCEEKVWPYVTSLFSIMPPSNSYISAKLHEIIIHGADHIKQDLNSIKACLASGFPICLGIQVFQSLESDAVSQNGVVPMPTQNDQNMGGHAIMIVGYDDNKQLFTFRNSWGTTWGDAGYGYLPYEYITNTTLTTDLWVIKKLKHDKHISAPPQEISLPVSQPPVQTEPIKIKRPPERKKHRPQ